MRKIARAIVFAILWISVPSGAAELHPALDFDMSIEPEIGLALREELSGIAQAALTLVQMFSPKGYENTLFDWPADREILKGKTLHLIFATSENRSIAPLLANWGTSGMDSFTMSTMSPESRTMNILVVLLVDRIFYDSGGNELRNGFSKLVVAFAHEIYGNVQHFLEFNMDGAKPQTMADRVNQQRKAARASLMFLGGLKDDPRFATLPDSTREGLMSLFPAEIMNFRSWYRAHPSEVLDPACEAMLRSLSPRDQQ